MIHHFFLLRGDCAIEPIWGQIKGTLVLGGYPPPQIDWGSNPGGYISLKTTRREEEDNEEEEEGEAEEEEEKEEEEEAVICIR